MKPAPRPSAPTAALAFGALCLLGAPGAFAANTFVLPSGSGDKSGKDIKNALPASGLAAALASAKGGDTVTLGSGTYDSGFTIKGGGSSANSMLTITGLDTGSGLPVIKGSFNPGDTKGPVAIGIDAGTEFLVLKDIRIENFAQAVKLKGGGTNSILVENVDVDVTRDAFWIDGGGANAGNHDLVFKDCDVTMAVKRGFRVVGGNKKVQFINCSADMGGKANAKEVFAVGFHVIGGEKGGDVKDSDITFKGCRASNAYHDAGPDKYWNADGFCAEGASENLTYIDCIAYSNTDGGWDLKATGMKLVNCIGIDNKRNFRFWKDTTLENCLSAFTHDRGNRNHQVGFWGKGGANFELTNCTFWETPRTAISIEDESAEKPTKITLKDCLFDDKAPTTNGFVTVADSGSVSGSITLKAPRKDWRGGDDDFDSTSHKGKGYHFVKSGSQASK